MSILPQPPSLLDILLDKVPSKPIKRKMRKVVAVITDAPPSLSFPLSDASPIWSGRVKKIKRGSVVHCDMAGPVLPSHSGIYLSKKKIVSLDSEGEVVVDNPEDFLCGEAEHIYGNL